jgi:nucleoside-diphosphate-sugar epimerase
LNISKRKEVVNEAVGAEERRHFTFVQDAAQATIKALRAEGNIHKVFNVAGGEDSYTTFKGFHSIIRDKVPSAGEVRFRGVGQDRGRVDITRAREELGYNPEYSLQQGIEEDIRFLLPQG